MYKKEWKFAIMSFKIAANIKIMMLSALESKKKKKKVFNNKILIKNQNYEFNHF